MERLNASGIKLTELEKNVIRHGLGQGSFYHEGDYDWSKSIVFGYDIAEELGGAKYRGPVADLVKKGVITVFSEDDPWSEVHSWYALNYRLDFDEDGSVVFAD